MVDTAPAVLKHCCSPAMPPAYTTQAPTLQPLTYLLHPCLLLCTHPDMHPLWKCSVHKLLSYPLHTHFPTPATHPHYTITHPNSPTSQTIHTQFVYTCVPQHMYTLPTHSQIHKYPLHQRYNLADTHKHFHSGPEYSLFLILPTHLQLDCKLQDRNNHFIFRV